MQWSSTPGPLATVAMVTYNSAPYIRDAIESVLVQSYSNLEIVICDDCSSDETWAIIGEYRDDRIRAYRNEANLGEYANRNQAWRLATGEYLIYIDGDDILYPHGLEFMVRMIEAFPEAAFAAARPWQPYFIYPALITPRDFYRHAMFGNSLAGLTFAHLLFRRGALAAVGGFDPRFRTGDTHIQFRIALTQPCLLISDGVSWWRRRPGQASERVLGSYVQVAEGVEYMAELLADPACPLTPAERAQARANLYGGFLRLLLYQVLRGRPGVARDLLARAPVPPLAWRHLARPRKQMVLPAEPLRSEWGRNPSP